MPHPNSNNLSREQVLAIFRDSRRQADIARDYGVKLGVVSSIQLRRCWRKFTDGEPDIPRSYHKPDRPGHAYLTAEQARQIFLDPRPIHEIAKQFDVCTTTVTNIKRRKSWKDATADLVKPPKLERRTA